jgi:hypothetical protein
MRRRVYILAISILGSVGSLSGCIASVDGTPTGEGEYNFDLEVGDISLDNFPVSASGAHSSINDYTGGDTDSDSNDGFGDDNEGYYCEMLCDCIEQSGEMDYDSCMATVSNLTDAQCQEAYGATC